jgi:hypothetical protein
MPREDPRWQPGTEADSMSSVTPKPCWDARPTLGRNKAARRIKTSTTWTPSPWKASPRHITLRKQEGSHHHQMPAPNLLGRHSADQTGEHQASRGIPPATPGIKQHRPLGRLTPPQKDWTINKELKLTHSRGVELLKEHQRRGEGQVADLHTNFQ